MLLIIQHVTLFTPPPPAFITASMVMLGEKLGGGPMDRSPDVLRIVLGALFSGVVGFVHRC
jgi:hypothetical protein